MVKINSNWNLMDHNRILCIDMKKNRDLFDILGKIFLNNLNDVDLLPGSLLMFNNKIFKK